MDEILNFIGTLIERGFRVFGLWVLRVLTGGRYKDTNSYLYFFPTFIGFLILAVLPGAIILTVLVSRP
ncbi:hypothetical protein [Phytopseudomonas dryadis]|uniref:Uncharacterized protein n=1 Tax=Phytopseudomonas dryadis TaxID=2487520 RepID=A0A4Q9R1D1_9GAMM|nr:MULTISPECIES: hypothetical protein [Pseudomonas]TBU91940.1 hypothetical protein DNK44_13485 [Pseudomonas dryadis]TBV00398.1 hypothetical protein DNK34_23585 [Pseudomonas dryadis]TBV12968.1 hypothetical protein DNK41_23620 [Pseudomonas sp. FRB 230]